MCIIPITIGPCVLEAADLYSSCVFLCVCVTYSDHAGFNTNVESFVRCCRINSRDHKRPD